MPLPSNVKLSHYAGTFDDAGGVGDAVEVVYKVATGLPAQPSVTCTTYLSDAALVARAVAGGGTDWGRPEVEEELALYLATPQDAPQPPQLQPAPEPVSLEAEVMADFPNAVAAADSPPPAPTPAE